MALENLTPLTREEKYLSKIAGEETTPPEPITREEQYLSKIAGADTVVPEPETRREYYLNKIAESGEGGGGDAPTGTISITSNGMHDVAKYAAANVNVASDFGTVEVTIVNETSQHTVSGSIPVTESHESIEYAGGEIWVDPGETSVFSVITYKGKCVFSLFEHPYSIEIDGNIEDVDGEYLITGDCTFTATDRV